MERMSNSGARGTEGAGCERRIAGDANTDEFLCRMLVKTTDYLDHFARFKRKENVEAVERLLSAHKELAKFERAQLGMYTSIRPLSESARQAMDSLLISA